MDFSVELFISVLESTMDLLVDAVSLLGPGVGASISAGAVNFITMSLWTLASLIEMCEPLLETFTEEQLKAMWEVLMATIGYMEVFLTQVGDIISSNTLDAISTELLEQLVGVLTQVIVNARYLAGLIAGLIF